MVTDRERAEQLLWKIIKDEITGPDKWAVQKEVDLIIAEFEAVRKERDAEWKLVAEYFIEKADALKDVRRYVDKEFIAALDNYCAARDGLKAFIEEVK